MLRKPAKVYSRSLLLLTADGIEHIHVVVDKCISTLQPCDITIHDFDDMLPNEPVISGRKFRVSEYSERLLNIATYVTDLREDTDKLWGKFDSKRRNAMRRVERDGYIFGYATTSGIELDQFYSLYTPIAERNKLVIPERTMINKMIEDGNAIVTFCRDKEGKAMVSNILYLAGRCGYYMNGATDDAAGSGVGRFTHWNNIMLLKGMGYHWYDLGGVKNPSVMDGIHTFKKSIGGTFCGLGKEYRYETKSFSLMRIASRKVRQAG